MKNHLTLALPADLTLGTALVLHSGLLRTTATLRSPAGVVLGGTWCAPGPKPSA
jgi:hypothetical protein